jgi:hypothetical protein
MSVGSTPRSLQKRSNPEMPIVSSPLSAIRTQAAWASAAAEGCAGTGVAGMARTLVTVEQDANFGCVHPGWCSHS